MVQVSEELDDEEMVKRAIAMSLEDAKEREEEFSSIKSELLKKTVCQSTATKNDYPS